jgi:hypothetical protein
MKRIFAEIRPAILLPALAMLTAGTVLVAPRPSLSQAVQLVEVDVKVLGRGYRASELRGQDVYNDKNEEIGEVDDIVIDKDRVLFVVLEVGGFLGIGGRLVAVTPQSLVVEEDGSTLRIKLPGGSREALENTTEFRYPNQSQEQPQSQQNQPQGQQQQPKQ